MSKRPPGYVCTQLYYSAFNIEVLINYIQVKYSKSLLFMSTHINLKRVRSKEYETITSIDNIKYVPPKLRTTLSL